jgi:hypothetical protein
MARPGYGALHAPTCASPTFPYVHGPMSTPIAWIAEMYDDDLDADSTPPELDRQDMWASGLFDTHALPNGFEVGPNGVQIEEALAWARARASRVVVRIISDAPDHFSAGSEPIVEEDGPLPSWPTPGLRLERRRAARYEFMDRTAEDPPIAWTAIVEVARGWGPAPDGIPEAIAASLAKTVADLGYRVVDPGPGPWEEPGVGAVYAVGGVHAKATFGAVLRARFTVEASTRDQAREAALAASVAALDQALAWFSIERGRLDDWDLESLAVYPTGSDLAAWNCAFDEEEEDEN